MPVEHCAHRLVGAGLLSLPFAFRKAGVLVAIPLLIGTCAISSYSCNLLISAYLRTGRASYGDLGLFLFGVKTSSFIQWCVILLNVGACSAYMVVIKDLLPRSFCIVIDMDGCFEETFKTNVLAASVFGVVFPLCCLKKIR